MAITETDVQIKWSTADTKSLTALAVSDSDEITLDQTTIARMVQVKADNDTATAAGDSVDFYWKVALGDPDGAGGDEYPTLGLYLATLDTHNGVTEGSGKYITETFEVPATGKKAKLYAVSNAPSDTIVVSASMTEKRSG